MSLRQRLRVQAEDQLNGLIEQTREVVGELVNKTPSLSVIDDMLKLAAGGRTESLRIKTITALTNYKEKELEDFFNKQQDLLIEEPKPKKESKK